MGLNRGECGTDRRARWVAVRWLRLKSNQRGRRCSSSHDEEGGGFVLSLADPSSASGHRLYWARGCSGRFLVVERAWLRAQKLAELPKKAYAQNKRDSRRRAISALGAIE